MKKIAVILFMLLCTGVSVYILTKPRNIQTPNPFSEKPTIHEITKDNIYSFDKENLPLECSSNDNEVCAVEKAVQCTINPNIDFCSKDLLPRFIFMQDENLERPSLITFKVTSKKILKNNTEIHTDSQCNGSWFGLCQGNVIYVVSQTPKNEFYVKDIYAIE